MSKPSVVTALKKDIFPSLADMGFKPFANKMYGRITNGIVQFLSLHVESRDSRMFMLEFGAMILAVSRDSFSLSPGGRFPDGKIGGII